MLDWLEFRESESDGEPREPVGRLRPADELLRSGRRLYYEGEFLLAAREFARARRHDPALFEAWAEETDACLRLGDVDGAEEVANDAIDSYGRVPVFYAAKALVLAHQGDAEAAYRHSDIAVEHDPSSMLTWLSRGEVIVSTREYGTMKSVEHCFQQAARRDRTRWRAKFRAALALMRWEQPARAIERLRQVGDLRPAIAFVWKLLGDCQRKLGDAAAAREAYRIALSRRPDYHPAADALSSMTLLGRLRTRLAAVFRRGQ